MRRHKLPIATVITLSLTGPELLMAPDYPETRRDSVVDIIHGEEVADPYRWLEDADQPEVTDWMAAQDAFARQRLAALPARAAVHRRLTELSYIDTVSAPEVRGERSFYWRRRGDAEKAAYYMADRDGERVLIDPNRPNQPDRSEQPDQPDRPEQPDQPARPDWSAQCTGGADRSADETGDRHGSGDVAITEAFPSRDGALVAYRQRENNADDAILCVLDTASGRIVDRVPGAMMAWPSWTPDGRGFYYVGLPEDPDIPADELVGYA
ncbi:MAG: hypothetical protein AAGC55_12170, partial [Myxococcota bacterium]